MESKVTSVEDDALLAKLEEYFADPRFTEAIHGWMTSKGMAVRVVDLEEEQPIENISYFHDYASMIASQLEAFVASQGTDGDTLVDALQRCQQSGCLSLSCMDYILASVEYEDFIGLVLDFQSASQWQDERGEADDDKAAV